MHLSRDRGLAYDGHSCVIEQSNTMTYEDRAEARRPSVGTKVLMVGFAVFAVLGSFWTIVWFIRSYVEAPRVGIPATMALAARESTPVVPAAPTVRPASMIAASSQPAEAAPAGAPSAEPAPPKEAQAATPAEPAASNAIADRWLPMTPAAPPPPPADPAPAATATTTEPAAVATADNDPPIDEVAESSVPAISGTAPLPRRKPTQTAAVRSRNTDPPLPRPRPDGPAPQSVWTAVPTTDDRFPQQ
jgi:hypothetical protein